RQPHRRDPRHRQSVRGRGAPDRPASGPRAAAARGRAGRRGAVRGRWPGQCAAAARAPGGRPCLSGPVTEGVIERARSGDGRALARLVALAENGGPGLRRVMKALAPRSGRARVIGLTGAPGVGKSTVTAALVGAYRARGVKVGVLAVDPTSPFSGGALLGDRIRMQDHATDPGVFIRSMATRGHLGGLSAAAPQALRVLDAVVCYVVLIETVGVGQSELYNEPPTAEIIVLSLPGALP